MNESDEVSSWLNLVKGRTIEVFQYLKYYTKNPVNGMKSPPDWDWPTLIALQVVAAASIGIITGLLSGSLLAAVGNLFISPIATLTMTFVCGGLFYYGIQLFFQRNVDFRLLYTILVLAQLPFLALRLLSPLGLPSDLIGLLITALLVCVGYVEVLKLPRRGVFKFVGTIYALFFVIWMVGILERSKHQVEVKKAVTPESLDILQKEVSGN